MDFKDILSVDNQPPADDVLRTIKAFGDFLVTLYDKTGDVDVEITTRFPRAR
jgi:hypothetical protein